MMKTPFVSQGVIMLNIELEMLSAVEQRSDWIREAELYRLTKSAQTEQESRPRPSIALASRSYAILLQAATQFLPFNTTLRQRPATLINPR